MMNFFILYLLLLGAFTKVKAETYTDEQIWINTNAFIKLNDSWQGYLEYQPRFFDYSKYNGLSLLRGAIGRNLGKGLSAWAGYGLMTLNVRKDSNFPSKYQHEDRPFLMVIHNSTSGEWKITNRTRFEDRLFRHDDESSKRLRHLLRAQYKFGESAWGLAVWDEWFWNANTNHPGSNERAPLLKEGFDQNRAFVGVIYFFGENHQHMVESGYMNNYVNGATRDRNAHVWMTSISARF
jgi:Protein of unknown function (DUF2490)